MNFRPAINSDIDHIIKINSRTVKWSKNSIFKEFKLKASKCFVLETNNQIFGYLMLRKIDSEIDITNFAIDADSQRIGYGTLLMKELLNTFSENHKIFIEVNISNISARKFYCKFGFKDVSIRKNYYNGNEDAIIMILEYEIA